MKTPIRFGALTRQWRQLRTMAEAADPSICHLNIPLPEQILAGIDSVSSQMAFFRGFASSLM